MGTSNLALPEIDPVFVVIACEESQINYEGKSYSPWSPEHATSMEEFELVVHWAINQKIPEPSELLEGMTKRNYPISLGLLVSVSSAVSINPLSEAHSTVVSNEVLPAA